MKKKQWSGTKKTLRKERPQLVGDSYQASKKDLKRLRRVAEYWGWSKAKVLRYAVKLVIAMASAQRLGKKEITFKIEE